MNCVETVPSVPPSDVTDNTVSYTYSDLIDAGLVAHQNGTRRYDTSTTRSDDLFATVTHGASDA